MSTRNLQHDVDERGSKPKSGRRAAPGPAETGNAARLSEDGDLSGDAAVRQATSTLAVMVVMLVGAAAIAALIVLRVGRSRRAARLEHTLMQLPVQGIDAIRRGVEHLVDRAA